MIKTLFRRIFNRWLHLLARFCPGGKTIRPFLHRLRGVQIHGEVFIGEDVILENEYPETIELHDRVFITLRSVIISHYYGQVGKVVVEKNVWIGPCCTIVASPGETLIIGEGSMLAAGSVVSKSIPPFTLVGGVPAKPLAKNRSPITKVCDYETWKKGLQPMVKWEDLNNQI
jgi:acetyltransferase-like isoleucine patch superfamily enzyme